jgi:bifunctional DNA-binding transcriptional regulator/antitoxin component of YhaV-PrlF toxin-antitoxin module
MVIMSAITLTTKRQATFPVQVCDDLNLRPGDVIELEPAELAGERAWVLRPQKPPQRPWLGCLAAKTAVTDHSLVAVRASGAAKVRDRGEVNP